MSLPASPAAPVFGRCSSPQACLCLSESNVDTLGFEPRAFRMRSGCDTTTPCALEVFARARTLAAARAPRANAGIRMRAQWDVERFFSAALAVLLRVFGRASPRRQGKEVELRNCRCVGRGANKPAEADAAGVLRAARGAEFLPAGSGARPPHLFRQPPWPNGQGVGLLIRRLRVKIPQGV